MLVNNTDNRYIDYHGLSIDETMKYIVGRKPIQTSPGASTPGDPSAAQPSWPGGCTQQLGRWAMMGWLR